MSSHLLGLRALLYSSPSIITKSASISFPPNRILALPLPAVVGVVVRSPVSVFKGSPWILPATDRTRCVLLTVLLTSADWLTNVLASGRGPPLGFLEPQPATRTAATLRAARTAKSRRRRVCIVCIVEGAPVAACEPVGCVRVAIV